MCLRHLYISIYISLYVCVFKLSLYSASRKKSENIGEQRKRERKNEQNKLEWGVLRRSIFSYNSIQSIATLSYLGDIFSAVCLKMTKREVSSQYYKIFHYWKIFSLKYTHTLTHSNFLTLFLSIFIHSLILWLVKNYITASWWF